MSTDRTDVRIHSHNVNKDQAENTARFGLRISLPPDDTFSEILGPSWTKECWYRTETDRDNAIREFRQQHPYYRMGDRPTLEIMKINRPA
ncbi:MAG: hypothetical protein HKN59_00240 [Gammaproteobacteria bacterium]|nr:hypothetical protein [Gammaproteobacteria bacterium]